MGEDFKALEIGAVAALISTTIWYYTGIPLFIPLFGCCLAVFVIAFLKGEHKAVYRGPDGFPFMFATTLIFIVSIVVTIMYIIHAIIG